MIEQIAAIAGISLSSWFISQGDKDTIGAATIHHFLISTTLLFPISLILYGFLLLSVGSVGLFLTFVKWKRLPWNLNRLNLSYHSLVFLSTINVTALTIFMTTGLVLSYQPKNPVYNPARWTTFIHGYPQFFCKLENRLDCAAFESGNCHPSVNNTVRYSNCPAVFCVEFCNLLADSPDLYSVQPICRSCFRPRRDLRPSFQKCYTHELTRTISGCRFHVNEDLSETYSHFAVVIAIYILAVSGLDFIAFYRHCCI